MDGSLITDETSKAYEVISSLEVKDGLYCDGKYIAIAISDYYGKVGDRFKTTLENGNVFYAIKSDTKKSEELNDKEEHPDGSMIEFIIDIKEAKKHYSLAIKMGDFNYVDEYKGSIKKIERLKK